MRKFLIIAITLVPAFAQAGSIRNERLYDHIVQIRDVDPDRFAGRHPFIDRIITDDAFFQEYRDRWQSHPKRFEHYHEVLWRILDGRPIPSPPPPPSGHLPGPPPPPPTPNGCGNPPIGVPEPNSLAILGVGLAVVGILGRLQGCGERIDHV